MLYLIFHTVSNPADINRFQSHTGINIFLCNNDIQIKDIMLLLENHFKVTGCWM